MLSALCPVCKLNWHEAQCLAMQQHTQHSPPDDVPHQNASIMCGVHAAAVNVQISMKAADVCTVSFSGASIRDNRNQWASVKHSGALFLRQSGADCNALMQALQKTPQRYMQARTKGPSKNGNSHNSRCHGMHQWVQAHVAVALKAHLCLWQQQETAAVGRTVGVIRRQSHCAFKPVRLHCSCLRLSSEP